MNTEATRSRPPTALALILIIALFMMRVSRAGLSGARPTPGGEAASPSPA